MSPGDGVKDTAATPQVGLIGWAAPGGVIAETVVGLSPTQQVK